MEVLTLCTIRNYLGLFHHVNLLRTIMHFLDLAYWQLLISLAAPLRKRLLPHQSNPHRPHNTFSINAPPSQTVILSGEINSNYNRTYVCLQVAFLLII